MEALIRWEDPELGFVSPMELIAVAEETGLIHELGEWVLMRACEQNKAWQRMGLPEIRIAVNISACQFRQPRLDETLLTMAQSLKIKIVAEGVETAEQHEILRTMGCDEYQGYICAPALPVDKATEFLRNYNSMKG